MIQNVFDQLNKKCRAFARRFVFLGVIAQFLFSLPPNPEFLTAVSVAYKCQRWLPVAERYVAQIDADLILSVMAAESGCDPNAVSSAGAVGLMQVIPRPWTLREDLLFQPVWSIWQGVQMLDAIYHSDQNDGTWRRALAAYNCGWVSLDAGRCVPGGGLDYADEILGLWFPIMRAVRMGIDEQLPAVFRAWNLRACYIAPDVAEQPGGETARRESLSLYIWRERLFASQFWEQVSGYPVGEGIPTAETGAGISGGISEGVK